MTSAESSLIDRPANAPFQAGDDGRSSSDRLDWLLYYGVAIGLARTEEPCEPIESLAQRARAAANGAFVRLNWDSPGAAASPTRSRARTPRRWPDGNANGLPKEA